MKVFFKSQDLWNLVENGYVDVADQREFDTLNKEKKDMLVDTRKKDQKALYAIFQAVEESVFGKILCTNTAKEA